MELIRGESGGSAAFQFFPEVERSQRLEELPKQLKQGFGLKSERMRRKTSFEGIPDTTREILLVARPDAGSHRHNHAFDDR